MFLTFCTVIGLAYRVEIFTTSPKALSKSFFMPGRIVESLSVFASWCFNSFPSFLRTKLSLPEKTVSLWSWVNRPQELERLTNPLYESNSLVIWPSVAPQSLLLWEGQSIKTYCVTHCVSISFYIFHFQNFIFQSASVSFEWCEAPKL